MNPVFLKQLQSQEDLFLTKLVEQKDLIGKLLGVNTGESTVLNEMIIDFKNKINPMIEQTLTKLVEIGKENMLLQSRYENANNQALLYQNVFSEISNYLGSLQTNYTQLWSITATLANLLVNNNRDTNFLKTNLMDFAKHKMQLMKRVQELESKLLTYEKREKWMYKEMEDLFTAPDLLINAKNSFEDLKDVIHSENQIKFEEYKNEIKKLNKEIEEVKNAADEKQKNDEEEKENLKKEIESMQNKISEIDNEKKQIEEEKKKVKEEHENYEKEMKAIIEKANMVDVLNLAINNFCELYGFLDFDGSSITVKTGEFTEKNALEKSLEAIKKENNKLKEKVQLLETSNQDITLSFQRNIDAIKTNSSNDIHLLKKELESAYETRDNLYSDISNLDFQVKQTNYEKQKLEQQMKILQKQNQELKNKTQKMFENEKQIITKYDEKLSILSKINSESSFIPEVKLPLLENADDIYIEANETLKKKIEELQKEKSDLNCKIEKITIDNKSLTESKNELSSKLEQVQKEQIKNVSEIRHWKEMHDRLHENICNSTQSNDSQQQYINQLERENQQLKEENEKNFNLEEKYNNLEMECEKLQLFKDKINKLEKENQKLKKENEENNNYKEKCNSLDMENTKLSLYKEKSLKIEKENQQLKKENEENNKLKEKYKNLEHKIKLLEEEKERLKEKVKKETEKGKTQSLVKKDPSHHTEPPEIPEPNLSETRDVQPKEEEPPRNEDKNIPSAKKQPIPKAQNSKPIPKPRSNSKKGNNNSGGGRGKQRK